MKLRTYLVVGMGLIVLSSCDQLLNNMGVSIDSDYYTYNLLIPPTKASDTLTQSMDIKSDVKQLMKEKGYSGATIQKIQITKALVEVNDQSQVPNLDAVRSVNIWVSSDSLSEKLIASGENDSTNVTQMALTVPDINVSDYLQNDVYNVKIQGILRNNLDSVLAVTVKFKYRVDLDMSLQQP